MTNRTISTAWNLLSNSGKAISDLVTRSGDQPSPFESLEPRTLMSGTPGLGDAPLLTPTNMAAQIASPTSVKLTWRDADVNAAGFYVLRSENGVDFSRVGVVTSGKTLTFTDTHALSNHTYQYEVQSYKGVNVSAVSNAAGAFTPLIAPSALTGVAQGLTGIRLAWRDNEPGANGFLIMRSLNGTTFTQLASIDDPAVVSYIDSDVASGVAYTYKVEAKVEGNASAFTAPVKVAIALAAPTNVQAVVAATSVSLSWDGLDPHARNYVVLRSADGRTFSTIATLGAGATSYTDTHVSTVTRYYYQVAATNGIAAAGKAAVMQITTGILAPSSVTASMSTTKVNLVWIDSNRAGMGYIVLRSIDGENFSAIATLAPGSSKKFTDATAANGTQYFYKVKAYVGTTVSEACSPATVNTPMGTSTVTITSRYGNELVINAYGAADTILVSQDDSGLTIVADGQTFSGITMPVGLFIYDHGVAETISIDASVSVHTTITALGGGITHINSASSHVSAWLDTTDFFSGQGVLHSIGTLAGNVSKAIGAALALPTDSGRTVKVAKSLFGSGPSADDINQGGVGDCYFLSSLAAFAGVNPNVLQESAVDMGDGTYIVQYTKSSRTMFIRVSSDMPVNSYGGFRFARPGESDTMWGMVMEKAFAYARTGVNTYASISSGWMGEVYSLFNVRSSSFSLSGPESAFFSMVSSDLASGHAVTFGTGSTAPSLVRGHAYTLISASIDENGVMRYIVRNPWGVAGDSLENSHGYATLTYAQMQANFVAGARAVA